MKLKLKLSINVIIIVLLIAIVGSIALNSYKNVDQTFHELDDDIIPGAFAMSDMELYTHQMQAILFFYTADGDKREDGKSRKARLSEVIESLRSAAAKHKDHETHVGLEEQKAAEELIMKIETISSIVWDLTKLKDQGTETNVLRNLTYEHFCPQFKLLLKQIREHKSVHMQELEESMESVSQAQDSCIQQILLSCFIALILAAITCICITNSITKALSEFKKGTGAEEGNTAVRSQDARHNPGDLQLRTQVNGPQLGQLP